MVIEMSNMFDISPTPQQAWNLQPLLIDHVNIGTDSPKMHSYRPVGSSGNTAKKHKIGSSLSNLCKIRFSVLQRSVETPCCFLCMHGAALMIVIMQ